jgi:hypothetical protein
VVGRDATHLRGRDGTDFSYETNTMYLGTGSTADVIFTAPPLQGSSTNKYLLYNRNFNRLTNPGLSGLGGHMTEIRVQLPGTLQPQMIPNTNPR